MLGMSGLQARVGHDSSLFLVPLPRYLDAPWHRSIVQQQLQDVEADDEHRDALGGAGRE